MELNDATPMNEAVKSNSKYLSKEDAGETGLILTIDHFTREVLTSEEKGDQDKTVCHWREDVKPMVLGKTTMTMLAYATGAKTLGEAKGKQVLVYCDPTVMFGTRMVGGLRIKKAEQKQPARPAARGSVRTDNRPTDDETVPF